MLFHGLHRHAPWPFLSLSLGHGAYAGDPVGSLWPISHRFACAAGDFGNCPCLLVSKSGQPPPLTAGLHQLVSTLSRTFCTWPGEGVVVCNGELLHRVHKTRIT